MTATTERLQHLANVKRGVDDPRDVGYYECCDIARELLDARERLAAAERDAERYRWLRQPGDTQAQVATLYWEDALDKEIDQRRSFNSGEKHVP